MSSVREGLSLKAALLSSAILPLSFGMALAQSAAPAASGQLPTVDVVATTPLGAEVNVLNVPSETQILTSETISNIHQQTLQDALARATPGISVTDSQGSPLYSSVDFRGETATPVPGTPEGLAVYMNGVRINEAYGDVVNWDLIPPSAISTAQIVTGNPVFGLNALAGAVVMQMKNGFNWQGTEINLQGGMDYSAQGYAEYGVNKGDWAYYIDIDGVGTNGFRYFGQSDAERAYADIGYRAWNSELHLSMTGGAAGVGIAGTTPLQLAQQNPWAVFTTPQTTDNAAEMITLSDETHITPTLTFNGNAYFRQYAAVHHDGNISDYFNCDAGAGLGPGGTNAACNGTDPVTGAGIPAPNVSNPFNLPDGQPLGEIDSNWTHTLSTGATGQLTDTDRILGHNNTITAGVSVDHGWTNFNGSSTLGTLPPNFVVPFTDNLINDPDNSIVPVSVRAQNTYIGVYVLDNFEITDRLGIHAGARFNDAIISLADQGGNESGGIAADGTQEPNINGNSSFNRINPVVGLTFKITPDIAAYASYSEANRAPTPLEIGCSSPQTPCVIDNFLSADPPLKQIVARTVEAGFKGSNVINWAWAPGRLDWSIAGYHTQNNNDIYSVPSPIDPTLGFFTNAGNTLREGVDIGATYTTDRWDVYASYSYIKATFLTPIALSSPNNPTADPDTGEIQVLPGDNIPGIPNHKFKFGMDYEVLPGWKVGGDVVYRSSQYYFGAENNTLGPGLNPQVSGFATIDLRTSYQVNRDLQIYGLVNNAANFRGATFGTLYETDSTTNQLTGGPAGLFASEDPRAITLAPPLEAMVGLKYTLNDAPPPAPPLVAKY
jgi:iron complex outermembrane receptor protein